LDAKNRERQKQASEDPHGASVDHCTPGRNGKIR
jgi:hypothetical protein